jgi:hypothetical protein
LEARGRNTAEMEKSGFFIFWVKDKKYFPGQTPNCQAT